MSGANASAIARSNQQSFSTNREAHLILLKLLTAINASPYRARASRPSAPAKVASRHCLMAQPPLLEKEIFAKVGETLL
jgi:hypothetical protein